MTEMRKPKKRPDLVGHYGCSNRLVKVVPSPRQPFETQMDGFYWRRLKWKIDCPACGRNHPIDPAPWRTRKRGERGEVVLPIRRQTRPKQTHKKK